MTNEEKLKQKILLLSNSQNWEDARTEWYLHKIKIGIDVCACGKKPIKKICIIKNNLTNESAIVGSSCVENFIGLPVEQIFSDIKKLQEDINCMINPLILNFAVQSNIVNDWEVGFYYDLFNLMSRRIKLSPKQKECIIRINNKLLKLVEEK